jgi:hypothetical protein
MSVVVRRIRQWRLHRRTGLDLDGLAEAINSVVAGWMNYYGRFYRSRMYPLLQRINTYLMRWAGRKYKRLRSYNRFKAWWLGVVDRGPELFAHWSWVRTFAGLRCEERSDGRLSRSVLWEPGGEIPPGDPTATIA